MAGGVSVARIVAINGRVRLLRSSPPGCQISLSDVSRFRDRVEPRQLMTNMELAENPEFMQHYMAALFLPHTDMGLFPTIKKKLEGVGSGRG